jgi:hypothetical protein
MKNFMHLAILLVCSLAALGQSEILTNQTIIELTKAGLAPDVIVSKMRSSSPKFDVSAAALIELKRSGVDDGVIAWMIDTSTKSSAASTQKQTPEIEELDRRRTPLEALTNAKTVAIHKSSLNPSRQALEKELMKRPDWRSFNLTIEEYKERADLYIDIGFVPLSLITHRYVYRIYDRRSGGVIAAGETTSWGSLAQNLARNISKSLTALRN